MVNAPISLTWTDAAGNDWVVECEVTHYVHVPPWSGSASSCPSADDYYGYTELEYRIEDIQADGWQCGLLDRVAAIYEAGNVDFKQQLIEKIKEPEHA